MTISIETAKEYITPGELEYARQYYKQNAGTYAARMAADLTRLPADQITDVVTALGVECALAADLQ